eukprot:TRINITY_DN8633_c0_g1_i2.p1 TRINITY_DN8633_c0_g1~~TRINITY_DN8633_c0_g1_i2.p1  ORF type:complete len:208 (-),score=45.61 TRINITY_DN8633_c0_g1_i2:900-1523(-)
MIGGCVFGLVQTSLQKKKEKPLEFNLKEKSCRFLVTGGTGFIGSKLCKSLLGEGHHITILTRDTNHAKKIFSYSDTGGLSLVDSIHNLDPKNSCFDVVINLAGEPIGEGRWTEKKKEKLFSSRINLTRELVEFLGKLEIPPKTFISGSAVGYYGVNRDHVTSEFSESTPPLETQSTCQVLCREWEDAAKGVQERGTRFPFFPFLSYF